MAWPYAGNWEGLNGGQIIHVAAAIATAINEREAAHYEYLTGSAPTTDDLTAWGLNSEDPEIIDPYPTASDIANATEQPGALNAKEWRYLMDELMGRIQGEISGIDWYDEAGVRITGIATLAAAEVQAGTLDPDEDNHRWQNASLWLTMKEALNRMIRIRKRVTIVASNASADVRRAIGVEDSIIGTDVDAEETWDNMLAASLETLSVSPYPGWAFSTSHQSRRSPAQTVRDHAASSKDYADTVVGGDVGVTVGTGAVPDLVTPYLAIATVGCTGVGSTGSEVTFLDQTFTITQNSYTFIGYEYFTLDGPTAPGTYPMTMEIPAALPSVHSTDFLDTPAGSEWDNVLFQNQIDTAANAVQQVIFDWYGDISPLLTDQD